jgi:hypothetical protein
MESSILVATLAADYMEKLRGVRQKIRYSRKQKIRYSRKRAQKKPGENRAFRSSN